MHASPISHMFARLPADLPSVLQCLHIALECKNQRFIDLVLQQYDLTALLKISLTYPSLVLARFAFAKCQMEVTLTINEATPLARLASRCGDVALLNKLLERCQKHDAKWLFENIIQLNFIPARDPSYSWLTVDRIAHYRKNQQTYRRLFLDNAAMLASHMLDDTFTFTTENNGQPNLNFLGRLRKSMAYAVHPSADAAEYGLLRHEQCSTKRCAEYEEYCDDCNPYIENATLDKDNPYNRISDLLKIIVYSAPVFREVKIKGQSVQLPLTTYSTHNIVKNKRCEFWQHPPHTSLSHYHALADQLYRSLDVQNPVNYLRGVLTIYFYNTHGLFWQMGSAACNDMKMHALLMKAHMLLPYENIGRSDCLAFSKIELEDFISRWPSVLGLQTLEESVEFLKSEYQQHCKNVLIEMTDSGQIRQIKALAAEPLKSDIKLTQQPSVLKNLVKKYLPEESPPFAKDVLEKCLRAVAANGTPQECRFLLAVVDVNACNEKASKNTALHLAVSYGQLQIVKILLAHPKIDKKAKNDKGHMPWQLISKHKGNPELHHALLEAYPKPSEGLTLAFK